MRLSRLVTPLFFATFLVSAVIMVSCEKEPDQIGLEITPPQDQMNGKMTDTVTIEAYSFEKDSIATALVDPSLLGSYFDPEMGRTVAGFCAQMLLSNVNVNFGTAPLVDSCVIYLAYDGHNGDTTIPQTIRVYELSQSLMTDTNYYSNQHLSHYNTEIGHITFLPRPTDSVKINGSKTLATLRINLTRTSTAFAQKLLNASSAQLADNATFLKYVKGLYFTADPANYKGCVSYFYLLSSLSKMTLYYKTSPQDSINNSYDYTFVSGVRFSHFEHDQYRHASVPFRKQIVYKDTTQGRQQLYLQTGGGVRVKLRFPYLKKFNTTRKVAINEAQLIIPNNDPGNDLTKPTKLSLVGINADGTLYQLADQSEGTEYFGGSMLDNYEYHFRITKYIQSLVSGTHTDYGLTLLIAGEANRFERLMIGGPKNPNKPIKLRIVYSYGN